MWSLWSEATYKTKNQGNYNLSEEKQQYELTPQKHSSRNSHEFSQNKPESETSAKTRNFTASLQWFMCTLEYLQQPV
jgi:hypothetical protein